MLWSIPFHGCTLTSLVVRLLMGLWSVPKFQYYKHSTPRYILKTLFSFQIQFNSVQLLSQIWLCRTPWTATRQASLSITNSRSLLKLMPIESVMPSNHLIFWRPLLLPPSVFPSIRVFSSESALPIRWPKYWSFSFNISPSNEYSGLISFGMDWLDLLAVQGDVRSCKNMRTVLRTFKAMWSIGSDLR